MMKTVRNGFTLIELLVVIAIIGILAAIGEVAINRVEIQAKLNDSNRLADLVSLQNAINVATSEASSIGPTIYCKPTGVYPCSGKSTDSGARLSDGTGWVKVDVSSQKSITLPTLPLDPVNSAAYHYTYCADNDAYELDAVLESNTYKDKMTTDGGNDDTKYEVGTNLNLIAASGGSCTY